MKKSLAIAMMALSLATGFLSFGSNSNDELAEEPLLSCPEECCTSERNHPAEKCCMDTQMCCE